ncbi:S8 family serine peptidase [Pseudaeromonas paramecii]|uniref:Peptidase S8 n=1 Tax=Pseudaeromonas paramecii TaxID=2138166 RepID=A0ABP8Q9L9_9GAMM
MKRIWLVWLLMLVGATTQATERFLLQANPGQYQALTQVLQHHGVKPALALPAHEAAAVYLTPADVAALRGHPALRWLETDVKRYPMSLPQQAPYGIGLVQADVAHLGSNFDSASGNLLVCIIDSGYDLTHEDLPSATVQGVSDPGGAGDWFVDDLHHGTHVAGTLAALDNSVGVLGILPGGQVGLGIVKVFDGDGWAYSSSLIAALDACRQLQAGRRLVVNMSLGGILSSRTEDRAFADAYKAGVLLVAAAGNDGSSRKSYPASYASVISVAALDEAKQIASFSQHNSAVELAAPGVGVLSSVPVGTALLGELNQGGHLYKALPMEGSPLASRTGSLVDCGQATTPCLAAGQADGGQGGLCLIARGSISFADKVLNCQAGGGRGAIIYNNVDGDLNGTLAGVVTQIPSVGIRQLDGLSLLAVVGQSAQLAVTQGDYAYYDGTSMATPHVAGVAALIWSRHLGCSNAEIRTALGSSALDLGDLGRDSFFGYGLVQAKAADDLLSADCGAGAGGDGGSGGSGGGKGRNKP